MSEGSDKRSVATDALETLGMIIDATQKRDAIHLAVEPIEAGENLWPGDDVGIFQGKAYRQGRAMGDGFILMGLGIVDPFVHKGIGVRQGQRFWLVVYPRQIHSLRHVWTHPAFPDAPELSDLKAPVVTAPDGTINVGETEYTRNMAESERWLRDWCGDADRPDYQMLIDGLAGEVEYSARGNVRGLTHDGEFLTTHGFSTSGEIPDEFWDHIEVVTGKKFERATHFNCSC